MTAHGCPAELWAIRSATERLEDRDPMAGLERVALWQDLRLARTELDVVYHDIERDATDALVELLRGSGEDTLETVYGPVHVGVTRPSEKWRGYDLLGALARNVADVDDDTGEIRGFIRAVPLPVLRNVVPGCSAEKLTSSRWRISALRDYVNPTRYVDRGEPVEVIRAGLPR